MQIKEAIILAGGLGTRLREAVPGLPKCMAPILAKPFIGYVIDYLQQQGIEKFIFSLGYKHEVIEQYLNTQYENIYRQYAVEKEPLGTGGAIKLACSKASETNVLVLNGDTFFQISVAQLSSFHNNVEAACTLCLKPMVNFDRYGVVELGDDNAIVKFKEKANYERGLINGGVYALAVNPFLEQRLPEKFSFERDYLEKCYDREKIYGLVQDEYFIDIGIPSDFELAQTELILHI